VREVRAAEAEAPRVISLTWLECSLYALGFVGLIAAALAAVWPKQVRRTH
jgi:hypothetical protein